MKRATGISTPMLCPLCDPGIQTAARHGSLRGLTGQFLVRPQFKVPCHHRLTVQIKTGKIQYMFKFSGTSATKSRARVTKLFFFYFGGPKLKLEGGLKANTCIVLLMWTDNFLPPSVLKCFYYCIASILPWSVNYQQHRTKHTFIHSCNARLPCLTRLPVSLHFSWEFLYPTVDKNHTDESEVHRVPI